STEAPDSRFSKSARTGILVPRNTQAPLTLSSTCSTCWHSAQSNMRTSYALLWRRTRIADSAPLACWRSAYFYRGAALHCTDCAFDVEKSRPTRREFAPQLAPCLYRRHAARSAYLFPAAGSL